MENNLRFHVMVLPNGRMHDLIDQFGWLEELGLEAAGLADHFVDWLHPADEWFEAWTALAAIAARTCSIRLGVYVTQVPLRNPAMFARQAMTVDHISDGRLEIALGTGLRADPSYSMAGLPNWTEGERVSRFAEYLDIVDALLTKEVSSYAGTYYSVTDACMSPRSVQSPRPPITVAALSPRMMRIAANRADTWNSLSFLDNFPDQIRQTSERVDMIGQFCTAAGRDPASLRYSYTMFDALSRSRGGSICYYESADLFTEMVGQIRALGIREIGIYMPTVRRQRRLFERIATDVLPGLRGPA